uniref:Uncharacterized protein n=1 Tax=Pristionchus pacificus TaxID=54126 RepID=A0A2A6CVN2_PRIPA|eukprot:PDM82245.1 hypothetical protein PRIPAC_36638 [Pristionchus pacificus]
MMSRVSSKIHDDEKVEKKVQRETIQCTNKENALIIFFNKDVDKFLADNIIEEFKTDATIYIRHIGCKCTN